MRVATGCGLSLAVLVLALAQRTDSTATEWHEDYYLGFSQGAYYGLMLAGEDYHVAWCMKSELEYEAAELGVGGEFQARLEGLLGECRRRHTVTP